MIFWNFKTPITLLACIAWNCSEYFNVSLGSFAPTVFQIAIGKNKKQP